MDFTKREIELIITGIHMLHSQCVCDDLDRDLAEELGGTPNDEEVFELKTRFLARKGG